MTLRGEIEAFPIETVIQLLASTSKTGQLEVRADDHGGTLGFDGGRLVAATSGDDAGETALGSVFAAPRGTFEFIPWTDPPPANLSGDLDHLLDRAVVERDRIIAIRGVIADDRGRFRLSERAADRGEVTLTADQWRTLLAVNGERDVRAIAGHLKVGRLTALGTLAGLVESGFIDVLDPPPPAPAAPPPAPPSAAPQPREWLTPRESLPEPERPAPPPAEARRAPAAPEPQQWSRPEPDLRADLAAALDERLSAAPAAPPEAAPGPTPAPPLDLPPAQDERLAALTGLFGPAQPAVPTEPAPAPPPDRISEWARGAAAPAPSAPAPDEWRAQAPAPAGEQKRAGLFGFLKREESTHEAAGSTTSVESRAGLLAAFSNALLAEYNTGQYGKTRIDDRMANLLMRVDEQADPIDRPLPIVDDRIDVQALEREGVPEAQAVPYLAMLVSQVYEDAERAFGKDKAKRGYRAAQQQVFGGDTSVLSSPDIAGRLPRP